jgi:hypothetical protein
MKSLRWLINEVYKPIWRKLKSAIIMLTIAGGILLALLFIVCIPLLLPILWYVVIQPLVYIIAAPFLLWGWIKKKLRGQ